MAWCPTICIPKEIKKNGLKLNAVVDLVIIAGAILIVRVAGGSSSCVEVYCFGFCFFICK